MENKLRIEELMEKYNNGVISEEEIHELTILSENLED